MKKTDPFYSAVKRFTLGMVFLMAAGCAFFPQPPAKPAAALVRLAEQDYPDFRLFAINYQSKADRRNTALLSIPKNVDNVPLLVALHGHETLWGKADSAAFRMGHVDDFCAYFASRGWAVLQPATMNHHLQQLG